MMLWVADNGIIYHRFVVNGKKLFANPFSNGVKAGTTAAG